MWGRLTDFSTTWEMENLVALRGGTNYLLDLAETVQGASVLEKRN